MLKGSLWIFLALLLLAPAANAAQIEGGFWDGRFGSIRARQGENGMAVDEQGRLVISLATMVSHTGADYGVLRWDGVRWENLTLQSATTVLARNGRVYCARNSNTGMANTWMFENGQTTTMGDGLYRQVHAMIFVGEDIVAGGAFTTSGAVSVLRVARWNGFNWLPIGGGLAGTVTTLATDGAQIFAAANLPTGVAVMRWDGAEWSQIGAFTRGTAATALVRAMCWRNGALYCGGNFSAVNGVDAQNLAVWRDGAWAQWGDGRIGGQVEGIVEFKGKLHISGDFSHPGLPGPVALFEAEGETWRPLLTGVADRGRTMLALEDELLVVASTPRAAESTMLGWAETVFRYRPDADWSVLGPLGWVDTIFTPLRFGELHNTPEGVFVSRNEDPSYTHQVRNPLVWNGARFVDTQLARTDGQPARLQAVMTIVGGVPHCHGTIPGEVQTHALFAFRNGAWEQATGSMPGAPAHLAAGPNEIAASIGNAVWIWDGVEWRQRGGSLGAPAKLVYFDGRLYAGGSIRTPSGNGFAVWNGSAWTAVGQGLTASASAGGIAAAHALHVSDGKLYVGGLFDAAGGLPATNLVKFDGLYWEPIPGFFNQNGAVIEIARSSDGLLAVAGDFGEVAGFTVAGLAIRAGERWQTPPLPRTFAFGGMRLLWRGHDLLMTGRFQHKGSVASYGFAIWRHPGVMMERFVDSAGRLRLEATGAAPGRYSIESSGNLEAWSVEGLNLLGEATPFLAPMVEGARFFRAAGAPQL